MNIFSNLGIVEILLILLLALVVIGPERLPEFGRKLGKTLRDVRRAYDNLTRDVGPELLSIQQTTQELRQSVEAVRSIPQDVIKSVAKAAEIDGALGDLKDTAQSLGQARQALTEAAQTVRNPIGAAASALQNTPSRDHAPTAAAAAGDDETAPNGTTEEEARS